MNEQQTVDYSAMPRNMKLTPRGQSTAPFSQKFPQIRGGTCEECGVIDSFQNGEVQYKLCKHYRGMEARCAYCPASKDQDEMVRSSTLNVRRHPYRPDEILMWCGSFECSKKHEEAFKS